MDDAKTVGIALALAAGAGLSTSVGSVISLLVKKPGPRFLAFTLGLSAGVMLLVSFVELLPHSISVIGFIAAHAAFLLGMLLFLGFDAAIPHDYILHQDHGGIYAGAGLGRTGLLVALGIGLHNLPEGMATFVSALKDLEIGIAVAIAIAVHNIPEGIAVAAPVYAATGSRRKAFLWSFLSGVTEPVGAGLAAFVLLPFISDVLMAWTIAIVAGIMVAISLDEIIPAAKEQQSEHVPILGIIAGVVIMALSLWLLGPHAHGGG